MPGSYSLPGKPILNDLKSHLLRHLKSHLSGSQELLRCHFLRESFPDYMDATVLKVYIWGPIKMPTKAHFLIRA
jgi:hypothetical protein